MKGGAAERVVRVDVDSAFDEPLYCGQISASSGFLQFSRVQAHQKRQTRRRS